MEMREKITAARNFVAKRFTQCCRINGYQQEIALPGKVFRCGRFHLCGCGEVDEAISQIDRGALKDAVR